MRVVCAAVAIALLAGPAYAQGKAVPRYGEAEKEKTRLEIEAEKAARKGLPEFAQQHPGQGAFRPLGQCAQRQQARGGRAGQNPQQREIAL